MRLTEKCVKCGCADIIQQAMAAADPEHALNGDLELRIRVDAKPDAILFHKAVRSPLSASVCAGCGYVEFYATEPESLHKALLAARGAALNLSRQG